MFIAGSGGVFLYNDISSYIENGNTNLASFSVDTLMILGSFFLAAVQNFKYDHVMESINKWRYEEKVCATYMKTPCGRSAVKAALKRTGNFEMYRELRDKYPLERLF